MRKTESSAELRGEINKILAKSSSVCTNFFLSADETEEAAAKGELYTHLTEHGILIFRLRNTHCRTYFYLTDPDTAVPCPLEMPAVLEIPYRERDLTAKSAVSAFERAGFSPLFGRIRMTRRGDPMSGAETVRPAEKADSDRIREIFSECFHPIAGCIPDESELIREIDCGHILTDETVSGLLHFTESRTGSELRHLAVTESMRNRGVGGALVRAYLSRYGEKKSTVWVREDNAPAIRTYEKYGYKADGMKSAVLICENNTESK